MRRCALRAGYAQTSLASQQSCGRMRCACGPQSLSPCCFVGGSPVTHPPARRGTACTSCRTRTGTERCATDRRQPTTWPGAGILAPAERADCGPTGRAGGATNAQTECRCLLDATAPLARRAVDRRRRVLQRLRLARLAQTLGRDLDRLRPRQQPGRLRVDHRRRGRRLLDLHLQVEQEADDLLLDAVEHLANMSKPSRWYSTSGSRCAWARRPMPSCR